LHAEQAHLVHLHQPGHRRGRIEWSLSVIDEFKEMVKDATYLYARTIAEPNTIDLMSYDPVTKKWFSFYEHFVKHWNSTDVTQQAH
jgi:ABC-type sulfate transport system substrate-binding protein